MSTTLSVISYPTTINAEIIDAKDLRLGDVVQSARTGLDGYSCATVIGVTDTDVTLYRPYIATEDFSYAAAQGGEQVIAYIGTSTYKVWRESGNKFFVTQRKELR